MRRYQAKLVPLVGLILPGLLLAAVGGCRSAAAQRADRVAKRNITDWVDPGCGADAAPVINLDELYAVAEQVRQSRIPAGPPAERKTVLALSGGGMYGAYAAGLLAGWTDAGTRPTFDVVTGISTGALIAVLAFLGPGCDADLRRAYTSVAADGIYRLKRPLRALLTDSIADNGPLRDRIAEATPDDRLRAVAAEHRKGRRLYVGTTDLDARRLVIWDLGAIACRDTPADRELFRKVLLASAAIPGFFPPVRIPVEVDGERFEERHVDGGVSASLFFVPPELLDKSHPAPLHGSDLYIIVAGKLYADPVAVRERSLNIAGNAISALLYAQSRGDLYRLYTLSMLTGMNYLLAALPAEVPAPTSSTDFDPEEMSKLFDVGYRQARSGTAWRPTPPGLEKGEGAAYRTGTTLTDIGRTGPRPSPPSVWRRLLPGALFRPAERGLLAPGQPVVK